MGADDPTEPVSEAASRQDGPDLYEVTDWEERSRLDGFAVALYRFGTASARGGVILLGVVLLFGIGAFSAVTDPVVGVLSVLSALPALGLAAYVYASDVTNEPLSLLLGTFLLSVVTATFAAVLNSFTQGFFSGLGVVGFVAFFFLFVGPVEETVKLLAVRLYAYRDERFDAVLDGAVYGAMAGLGFAFIENALYIERGLMGTDAGTGLALAVAGTEITLTRALAGPGHVIYSAFAGYYLGLAKFNPENRGPIVIKGLLIAAVIHATYNSTVGVGAAVFAALGLPDLVAAFAYILLYDGLFGALLLRKINRYRRTYRRVGAGTPEPSATATGPDVDASTTSAAGEISPENDTVATDGSEPSGSDEVERE
jgi:RsiW-degrading membrane proteinase PrsW (M82 family)